MEKQNVQYIAAISLFVITFLVYGNTLNHGFVLDDKIVITENSFTKKGTEGIKDIFSNDSMTGFFGGSRNLVQGGRYRPLSMTTHALEWELVGDDPWLYHFNNVLFYALGGVLLFFLLTRLLPPDKDKHWFLSIAFLATLFFQINPLHTEVVANVKSRDEILSICLAFASLLAILEYSKKKKPLFLVFGALLFLASLLSKESSIVLVGIFPLLVWVLKKEMKANELLPLVGALLLPALIYLGIRWQIIGGSQTEVMRELMNNPYLNASGSEKWATTILVLGMYIKLLIWPHPLTHDYYPNQIAFTTWSDPMVILAILLHLGLVFLMIRSLKNRSIWGLAAGIYLGGIFLYSNIVFQIGTFMNERFLYVPVLGLSLVLAYVIQRFVKNQAAQFTLIGLLVLAYGFKTVTRNAVWESDATLALTDVKVSSNSAKANLSAGIAVLDRADAERNPNKKERDIKEGVRYLNRALEIYPGYSPPILLLGNANTKLKQYDQAIAYYDRCLRSKTQFKFALQNLEVVAGMATTDQQFPTAEKALRTHLKYQQKASVLESLGELYGKNYGNLDTSIFYLEKAYVLDNKNPNIVQKLGVANALSGRNQKAVEYFELGVKLNPDNANMNLNLGYAYHAVGRIEDSERYLEVAYKLDPKLAPKNPEP